MDLILKEMKLYYINSELQYVPATKLFVKWVLIVAAMLTVGIYSHYNFMYKPVIRTVVKIDTLYKEINPYKLELNDSNLLKEIKRNEIYFPKVVLSQAKLETYNYTSNICVENNNIFGFKVFGSWKGYELPFKNRNHLVFRHWTECVKHYKMHQQKNFKRRYYLSYLQRLGYAEAKNYIKVLENM